MNAIRISDKQLRELVSMPHGQRLVFDVVGVRPGEADAPLKMQVEKAGVHVLIHDIAEEEHLDPFEV